MPGWRKWPVQDIPSISKNLRSLIASCWSSLLKWEYELRAPPAVRHRLEFTVPCFMFFPPLLAGEGRGEGRLQTLSRLPKPLTLTPSQREGPPLMRRPSADAVAGNGGTLSWAPSADAVA